MSTYLNKKFGADDYAKYRPTYPWSLYEHIKEYHDKVTGGKPIKEAVDLACGTGQATQDVAKLSEHVIGFDHAEVMVEQANKQFSDSQFDFKVGADLTFAKELKPGSVDLLTVAEAAHYFHYPEFWGEAAKVLAPGGTLAIFSYFLFAFPDYPEVGELIKGYALDSDKCGPYFDSGIDLLSNQYRDLVENIPKNEFDQIEHRTNLNTEFRPTDPFELVKKDTPVGLMISLLKTWSPYFNWKNDNPGKPDIADAVMEEITKRTGLTADDRVTVKWDTVILLATRK